MALLALATPACPSDRDDVVTIFGPGAEDELESLQDVLEAFSDRSGIAVEVEGSENFEAEIGSRIEAGNAPGIAMFPQPGKVRELTEAIEPLPDSVVESAEENFDDDFTDLVRFDDQLWAVPTETNFKSLVWYSPSAFADAGYGDPATVESFDDFLALADRMRASGDPPFCVGIESGVASGWPLTDWIEDFLLRIEGPAFYDQWARHEIEFNHPRVVAVAEAVFDLWSQEGFIFGGTQAAAATNERDAGLPVLDGECMMHRQASFYDVNWPEGADVAAFPLPGSPEHPDITLTGGQYAAAFDDDEDVTRVLEFLASTEFANAMASHPNGGFLSPNRHVDVDEYPDQRTRDLAGLLQDAEPVRFDASDLMPGVVGSGTYWTAAVDITVGSEDVATAFAEVEENWPEE